jgi:PleD family two-component response regulator
VQIRRGRVHRYLFSDFGGEGLEIVAEKIRNAVEQYDFPFQDRQPNGNLTISVGAVYCAEPNLEKRRPDKKS